MSKSSIKTKTILTMTDMTQSTELQAFIREKNGYKVTVKISLCVFVVLSWDELEVRQNLLDSDYEIYMVRLLVATVNWHKSLQFVNRSSTFVTRGHTTWVISTVKIWICERSNEKSHSSKTKIYFHKKTTPQLLEHIGLQNMKVGVKSHLGDLPLFVWCLLTLALKMKSIVWLIDWFGRQHLTSSHPFVTLVTF